jgi:catechol 2,3-dioxygenase-like lactoylglutathione lyase family enzyme
MFPLLALGQPGFIVPDIAAAERHGGRLQNPSEQRDGRTHAAVRDPDGNTVGIYSAQPAADPAPVFATRGAFFALSVPDVEASAKWYAEKFGMKVVLSPPKQEQSRMMALEGGGLLIELLQRDDAMPLERAAAGIKQNYRVHGFFKAGIVVDDFDKTLATLEARGVEIAIGPFPARADQRANAIIKDNAGNLIQLFGNYR